MGITCARVGLNVIRRKIISYKTRSSKNFIFAVFFYFFDKVKIIIDRLRSIEVLRSMVTIINCFSKLLSID